jgi:hypothetical protein
LFRTWHHINEFWRGFPHLVKNIPCTNAGSTLDRAFVSYTFGTSLSLI